MCILEQILIKIYGWTLYSIVMQLQDFRVSFYFLIHVDTNFLCRSGVNIKCFIYQNIGHSNHLNCLKVKFE